MGGERESICTRTYSYAYIHDIRSARHATQRRCGHGESADDEDTAPIFIQFLDCVWQMLQQYPTSFGFTSRLLEILGDEAYVGRDLNLACNCEKTRGLLGVRAALGITDFPRALVSVWSFIAPHVEHVRNPNFAPDGPKHAVLRPRTHLDDLELWSSYYLRWLPTLHPHGAAPARTPSRALRARRWLPNRVPEACASTTLLSPPPCFGAGGGTVRQLRPVGQDRAGDNADGHRGDIASMAYASPSRPARQQRWGDGGGGVIHEAAQNLVDRFMGMGWAGGAGKGGPATTFARSPRRGQEEPPGHNGGVSGRTVWAKNRGSTGNAFEGTLPHVSDRAAMVSAVSCIASCTCTHVRTLARRLSVCLSVCLCLSRSLALS